MPTSISKNELFKSGPISFSELQKNLGGSPDDVKISKYLRDVDPENATPYVPDATENEEIPSIPEDVKVSNYRNMINSYEILQNGTDQNLDLSENIIIDEETETVSGYTGPWNGNLGKNIIKKLTIDGECGSLSVGKPAVSMIGEMSNVNFEVTDNGSVYGAGGKFGNSGDAPQTSIRTASIYHVFNNASDQTFTNTSTGGIKVEIVNASGPDGLKLNGDVTSYAALYLAKHYKIIFDNPYLDTNYTILPTNIGDYTAGGGYGKPAVEGIGDKTTNGFRIWFKRTVAPGPGGVNANTYIRSCLIQTEGKSSGKITPITFNLTSSSFSDGDLITTPFLLQSSGGQNLTPQLSWSLQGLPSGVSVNRYEIYLEDLSTSNSFRHWELENISPSVNNISQGQNTVPLGATIVPTDYGTGVNNGAGYAGPTIIAGEIHHYRLTVKAILNGSPSTPTAALEFYAGSGTVIPDKNPVTNPTVTTVVTGAGVNELGTAGGPGGPGGMALYLNNVSNRSSESSKIKVKLNQNAKIWAGGGGGAGGFPGKNGPVITCISTFTFSNSPSTGGGGSRNCPSDSPCPSGSSQVSCNPNDVRSRCRGSSPRRGESGYVCAGNWTRTCQTTSSNLSQGLGGSGGVGGSGRGYQNFSNPLTGTQGTSGTQNSCSGSTSKGNPGNPGSSGGDWGQDGGGVGGGKRGAALTISKYNMIGKTTINLKGSIIEV